MSGELKEELIINKNLTETELSGKLQEINLNLWKIQEQIKRLEIMLGKRIIREVKEESGVNEESGSNFDKYKGSLISRIC